MRTHHRSTSRLLEVVSYLVVLAALGSWVTGGPARTVADDLAATITTAVPTMPGTERLTSGVETIATLAESMAGVGQVQDRMVDQVAEQCAVILTIDDECVIRVATPAEDAAQTEQLLNTLEGK